MSEEEKKDEKQDQPVEQPAAGVPPETEKDAQAPPAADADNSVPPLPNGAPARGDQEQQQGAGCDTTLVPDGIEKDNPVDAAHCDLPESAPDTQVEPNGVLPCTAEEQKKMVSTDGTNAPQGEVSPEMDDPFTGTDETEEEKQKIARVMATYRPYSGCREMHDSEDEPDVAGEERGRTIGSEYEQYQPEPTLALIRREGRIHQARIEWKGLRPAVTLVSDRYSIPSMSSAVYRSLRLPSDVAQYQSARQVFGAVYSLLKSCSALTKQQCEVLTSWSIATWFAESLGYIPRLTITGPWYAADHLLTLLSYVSHKAILLVGMNSALLKQVDMQRLNPTLLIHQVRASKTATELLDASDYPGYVFVSGGDLHQFCCPRAVYIGETYNSSQRMSGLHIHLGRHTPVPVRPYWSSAVIERTQNQLLSYSAFNHNRTDFLELSPGELEPEFDLMARRLGAVFVNDSALRRRLAELLKGWSEDVRAERAGGIEATVLTAALKLGHGSEPKAYAREIAAGVNQIGTERGESYKLSNEKVGRVLRELGLRTRHDMNGRALVFDQATQVLLHELCFEYDVLPAAPQCGYCHKLQAPESE